MGFFSRWFEAKDKGGPIARTITIEDGLTMDVRSASVHGRDVVVFTSRGLAPHGQAEIAIPLARSAAIAAGDHDASLAAFFRTVQQLARNGQLVHSGGFTELGARGFLAPHLAGLIYADGAWAPELTSPDTLLGLAVHRDELRLARATSPYRVLARLGRDASWFPFPPFADLAPRASVASDGDPTSLLTGTASLTVPGVSITVQGEVTIEIAPHAVEPLRAALASAPEDAVFALMGAPSSAARAWMVWEPGQSAPAAITAAGSSGGRMAAHFVMLVPGMERDEVRLFEDGVGALLTTGSASRVRAALASGEPLRIAGGERALAIALLRTEHVSRVDGARYVAPGGMHEYLPEGRPARRGEQVILLSTEAELRAAVETDALASYVRQLFETVRAHVEGPIALRVSLAPGSAPEITSRPPLKGDALRAVRGVDAPVVRGPIAVELELDMLQPE